MPTSAPVRKSPPDAPLPGLLVSFKNPRGLRLAGELLLPACEGPHRVVVFSHGARRSPAHALGRMAAGLAREGIASLAFDFTGRGESEGTEADDTPSQRAADLGTAIDILETFDEIDPGRVGVAGTGSGAAAALSLAGRDPRIRALVLEFGDVEGLGAAASQVTAPTLLVVDESDGMAGQDLLRLLAGPRGLVPRGPREGAEAFGGAVPFVTAWFKRHLA